jgi:transcriptional regulator with PAS, ATPase and Fis domain
VDLENRPLTDDGDAGSENLVRRLRDAQALGTLVGEAPAFLKAVAQLPAAARSDAAVLITGETGTGKELVARAIHYLSDRAPLPFVSVNCGSLTDALLDDRLFGHEQGALTDNSLGPGLLAQAGKGTLFLDEIEALTDRGQTTLLRLVQDRTFCALGGSAEQYVPARFVAATNVDLWPHVQAGTFRPDLYYRLGAFSITLPSLRERKDDILRLALHFLKKHASPERAVPTLGPSARAALLDFDWPGNVRELENTMIRAIQACGRDSIEADDLGLPGRPEGALPPAPGPKRSFKVLKRLAVEAFERDYLTRILREHGGNVTHAARTAAKDRRDLGRLLKKYAIDPRIFARGGGGGVVRGGGGPG